MPAELDTMDVDLSNLYNLDFPYLLCQNRKSSSSSQNDGMAYVGKDFNVRPPDMAGAVAQIHSRSSFFC